MKITIDTTGHGWIYSDVQRRWVMSRCSCPETSPRCPMPGTKAEGKVAGKRRKATSEDILRFEQNVMAFEGPIIEI